MIFQGVQFVSRIRIVARGGDACHLPWQKSLEKRHALSQELVEKFGWVENTRKFATVMRTTATWGRRMVCHWHQVKLSLSG